MTVLASTVTLALAWFAGINLAVSAACWVAARAFQDTVAVSRRRSQALLLLRLLPSVAAAAAAFVLFAPTHARLEPANADERYGLVVIACAAVGTILILRSLWLAARVACGARRLRQLGVRRERHDRIELAEVPFTGLIALAGVVRPRILIGSQARQALTDDELDAAVAHEMAHRDVADNLARTAMACAPDFLGLTRSGQRLERLWEAEAECLADARAALGSAERARHLASALIKVARLCGRRRASSPAWSLLHQPALLKLRVQLLVEGGAAVADTGPRLVRWFGMFLAAVVAAAWVSGLPGELHRITEFLLARLP